MTVRLNGQDPLIQGWTSGATTTAKTVGRVTSGEDQVRLLQHVGIKHLTSTPASVVFSGGAGPAYTLDGSVTRRAAISVGQYAFSHLYFYFTSEVGVANVAVRFYFAGRDTFSGVLQADDTALGDQWNELLYPDYRSEDPTWINGLIETTDTANPSAAFSNYTAVAGTRYRVDGYELVSTATATSAGLEATDGANLTPLMPFGANGGIVSGVGPIYVPVGLGVRIHKSAVAGIAGRLIGRKHPLVVTAPVEGAVLIPRCQGLAVEVIGTGMTVGVDMITMEWWHVGYAG